MSCGFPYCGGNDCANCNKPRAEAVRQAEAELEEMRQHGNADDATEAAAHLERLRHAAGEVVPAKATPAAVERCRLLDELILSWRDPGNSLEQMERRIQARAAVEEAWPCGALASHIDGDQPLPDLILRLHLDGLGRDEIASVLARLGRDSEADAAGISIRAVIEEAEEARAALSAAGVGVPTTVTDDEVFAALQRHHLRLDSAQARVDMRRTLEGFLADRARGVALPDGTQQQGGQ